MSRLIVKNIPKYLNEKRLREHFEQQGELTDVRVQRTPSGESRRFGFVGYKSAEDAERARRFFNRTFIDTARISVEVAQDADARSERPWSKYSRGSSAHDARTAKAAGGAVAAAATTRADAAGDAAADAGESAAERLRKEEALAAFLAASSGNKRKAWESDLVLPTPTPAASDAPAKRARAQPDAEPTEPTAEPLEVAAAPTDALVFDDGVSDLDYLRSRMVSEDLGSGQRTANTATADDDDGSSSSSSSSSSASTSDKAQRGAVSANNARLFVRNLAYSVTEDELIAHFGSYGPLQDVHVPIDSSTRRARGFAFVQFQQPLNALQAQVETDGRIFQGRVLRVQLAEAASNQSTADANAAKSKAPGAYSKQKQAKLRSEKSNADVWASLFVRGDVVAKATAERLGIDRAEMMTEGSAGDAAVRLALGEAQTIAETKKFFEEHGVTVEPPPGPVVRSRTVLIVKNLPYNTEHKKLLDLFERHGDVVQLLLPPSKALAIVEFDEVNHAKAAFNALAYAPFAGAPLFLEWAPEGLLSEDQKARVAALEAAKAKAKADADAEVAAKAAEAAELAKAKAEQAKKAQLTTRDHVIEDGDEDDARAQALAATQARTLFVRNLNFATDKTALGDLFEKKLGKGRLRTVTIARDSAKKRSAGYGFVEFATRDAALKAYRTMQGVKLDGHELELQLSGKGVTDGKAKKETKAAQAKRASKAQQRVSEAPTKVQSEKLAVKNIAFEASAKELRALFETFGSIKKLRVPKKFDGSLRGFAFVTFATKTEAQAAADALKHTHFYGRHLVVESAAE